MRGKTENYRGIASDIKKRIAAGEFAPGEPIPSIRDLVSSYGVAPMTVRRALSVLCSAGQLQSVRGVGSFVSEGCPLDGIVLVSTFRAQEKLHDTRDAQYVALAGAQQASTEAGIPIITVSEEDTPERFVMGNHGFLLLFSSFDAIELAKWTNAIMTARAPYVSIGYDNGLPNFITRDDHAASRKALRHLYSLGHRHIALLPQLRSRARLDLAPIHMNDAADLVVQMYPIKVSSALDAQERLDVVRAALEQAFAEPNRPTAVVAGTGEFVPDTMSGLRDLGIRVPEDCSVVGYCREVFDNWNGQRITRVDNPRRTIAHRAIQELIKMGAGGGYQCGRVLVKPEFFEGDTCAEAPRDPTRTTALGSLAHT